MEISRFPGNTVIRGQLTNSPTPPPPQKGGQKIQGRHTYFHFSGQLGGISTHWTDRAFFAPSH